MQCVQVSKANGPFEQTKRAIPEPKEEQVLVKVEACGVCHSDVFIKSGAGGANYPRVPGHEVVGTVVKLGPQAKRFKVGDRVGRGWHGGHCFACDPCVQGDFIGCTKALVSGLTSDGGYAEYMVAPWQSLARVPVELSSSDAAPLLCAGLTVFNAIRKQNVPVGELVAVQGIGGLGHLAIQFARKMGYRVVALSSGDSKRALATQLGAHVYIDCSKGDVAAELQKLGGAKLIVGTSPSSKNVRQFVDGLKTEGRLVLVGASMEGLDASAAQLIVGRRGIVGSLIGTVSDAEDTLKFAALQGVKPMVEVVPLSKVDTAFERMMTNQARFREVLVPDTLLNK